ncbi:MAG: murein biosynthesis integral membrane protein MurJ [Chloroflexota bacterium]|nr:murein biosynthesis integral membrane protein MurJ [Chloroflexota bacterium]
MLRTLKARFFTDEDGAGIDRPLVQPPSLAMAASVVALGFLASRVLGLLRTVVIAHQYGTSPSLDAYFVAFRVPDLIFQLLAGATLGSAFIPTFARVMKDRGEREAWRLASTVLNLVLAATLVFALIALLLAPVIVPITAPGLGDDTGQHAQLTSLAVDLTRIMMISPVLFAVSGMFMGILNSRHHFLAPAFAPIFYNIAIIVGAFFSKDVKVLALAVVIGALLHLVVQLPALRLVGMRWQPVWDWKDKAVREVGRLMGPRVIGLAAFQLNFLIATFFASTVRDGAISAVNYAWLLVMTPLGVFGMAISTAAFPRMAEQAALDNGELPDTLSRALRLILYLTIPASVGLMVLAKPITAFLLRSGAFNSASTDLVVGAVVFYSLALFAHAGIEILSRGYYAMSDTRTPVAFAVISMTINLVLSLILVWPFGIKGLAFSLSAATIVEFVLLLRTLMRRMDGLDPVKLAISVTRTLTATILMAEVIALWLALLSLVGLLQLDKKVLSGFAAISGVGIGTVVFFYTSRVLRSEEAEVLLQRLPLPARVRAWTR